MDTTGKPWASDQRDDDDESDDSLGELGHVVPSQRVYRNDAEEVEEDQSTASCRQQSHPVNINELRWSTEEGRALGRGEFSFFIDDLPIKRDISRDVDLEELVDLEYVTEGSSSHIFSAIWRDEQVIVKVMLIHLTVDCVLMSLLFIMGFNFEGH